MRWFLPFLLSVVSASAVQLPLKPFERFNPFGVSTSDFTPESISGLQIDIDASRGTYTDAARTTATTTDGTAILGLADQSGNGHHGSASSGQGPLLKTNIFNGKSVLRFDASNDLLDFGNFMAGANAITVVMVMAPLTTASTAFGVSKHGAYAGGSSGDGEWLFRATTNTTVKDSIHWGMQAPDGSFPDGAQDAYSGFPSLAIQMVTWTGSSEPILYENGIVKTLASTPSGWATFSAAPTTTNTVKVGGVPGLLNPQGGDAARVLIYNKVLSPTERGNLNTYLRQRYWSRQLIVDGDSQSSGQTDNVKRWSDQAWPNLTGKPLMYNIAVSGQRIQDQLADWSTEVAPLYDATLSKNIYVAWCGTNNGYLGDETGAQGYARLTTLINQAHTTGLKIVVATALTRTDVGLSASYPTYQANFNALVLANSAGADGVADPAADSRLQDSTNTTYFQADHVHVTDAGAVVVAGIMYPVINAQ